MVHSKKSAFTTAIILAAGAGTRMGGDVTKQRLVINGKSVLRRAVEAFVLSPVINSVVVVSRNDEIEFAKEELADISEKPIYFAIGGKNRAESAKLGFMAIPKESEFVAIHDAARCLILPDDVSRVVESAVEFGASCAAGRVVDTIKRVDSFGGVVETVDRENLRRMQTPQVFSTRLYASALQRIEDSELEFITDDCMLLERCGVTVRTVDVGSYNFKITTKDDILYAEFLLNSRG